MITKSEAATLAELVYTTDNPHADTAILWAVKYHLALVLWGLETGDSLVNNLLKACNTMREDNIIQRIGLERLEALRDEPLVKLSTAFRNSGFIETCPDSLAPDQTAPGVLSSGF